MFDQAESQSMERPRSTEAVQKRLAVEAVK